MAIVTKEFFERESLEVAKDLIGKMITRDYGNNIHVGGIICQADAYSLPKDENFKITKKTGGALYPAGAIHMYPSQAGHMLAVSTFAPHIYNEILIRQLIPLIGVEKMLLDRGITDKSRLGNGPGNLVKSLGLDAEWDSRMIFEPAWGLCLEDHINNAELIFESKVPGAGKDFVGRYTLKNKIF